MSPEILFLGELPCSQQVTFHFHSWGKCLCSKGLFSFAAEL